MCHAIRTNHTNKKANTTTRQTRTYTQNTKQIGTFQSTNRKSISNKTDNNSSKVEVHFT
ncbi:19186_t:CDS:2 [Gigaspora rosea]|nr:19186_t:CDS:2 [Gigaspora rosea]